MNSLRNRLIVVYSKYILCYVYICISICGMYVTFPYLDCLQFPLFVCVIFKYFVVPIFRSNAQLAHIHIYSRYMSTNDMRYRTI